MFSLGGIPPQAVFPVGHVASALNTLRNTAAVRQYRPHHGAAATADVELTDNFRQIVDELGLSNIEELQRAKLTCSVLSHAKHSSTTKALDRHASENSFFENRYGFTEQELWDSTFGGQPLKFTVTLPTRTGGTRQRHWLPQTFLQQSRGFKTRRSTTASGLGRKKHTEDSFQAVKYLRESVFDRLSGSQKKGQSDKLKTFIREHEHNPEIQDKLKVSFAEGYAAREKSPEQSTLGRRVLRMFLWGTVCYVIFQLVQGNGLLGGNMKINVLQGEVHQVSPEDISVTFDDVKGVDEAKQELKDVVEFLKDPERFEALGAKLPKGVLLVGPPGIGKTLLAKAVAGEAQVPFFIASGSEFDEVFVGTGAKRVRQLFDAAKTRAPCVIFIDEIDTVGAKRTSSQIHPYANQTINQLLSEMDGFEQNEGVIVLGATNRRDNLDRALLRPGRFDVEVRVFPPDVKGRRDILDLYLAKVKVDGDIDVDSLARGTTGFTGADLENMVNQAALKAVIDGDKTVKMCHMEHAKDKVLMGPAKKTKLVDEDTNVMTAYHEAGHTIVAFFTKDSTPLHKVTIIPRGTSLGHTSFVPEKEQYSVSKSQLMAQMDVAMGGRVAEELIYGSEKVTTGASSDFGGATAIATAMVKKYGMSEKVGFRVFGDEAADIGWSLLSVNDVSPATTEIVDNEIKRLLQESYDRAKHILKTHSAEHKALAQALLKYETLDAEEIKEIIEKKTFHRAV